MKKKLVALLVVMAMIALVACGGGNSGGSSGGSSDGGGDAEATSIDKLTVMFVPSRPAEEIISATSGLGDLLIAGFAEKGGTPLFSRGKAGIGHPEK